MHAYRDQYASLFRGGKDIVLIGISTDSPEEQSSWLRDDEMPFLFASDVGGEIGQKYGAFIKRSEGIMDNRTLFIVDKDGQIAYLAAPFRQMDPTAYTDLGEALDRIAPVAAEEPGN